MEMGFAAALGVPIVIVSTDFQTYGPEPDRPGFAFPEPLLDQLAATVERAHRLGPPRRPGDSDRFRLFLAQNLDPIHAAATRAINALLSARPPSLPPARSSPASERRAFIEPSPYMADEMWTAVADTLRAKGWTVHVAKRLRPGADTVKEAQADWAAARGNEPSGHRRTRPRNAAGCRLNHRCLRRYRTTRSCGSHRHLADLR